MDSIITARDYDPDSAEARNCISQPVGVHTLASSPTNPRKSFPEAAMAELIESVKQHSILTPIMVRCWPTTYPWTGDMPLFEVVAGERRFRAAKAAGLFLIPAMVRNLTDEQVLEIQVIENLQREGVHPLEEAEGYGLMMENYNYTADQIAEKIGKSRSYIFSRLKLLNLDTESRRLFSSGLLNASTALLVARIPIAALRAKAVKEITEKDYNGDTKSVRQAQRWIRDRYTLKLAGATFPIDDATFCGGACSDCPKRTGNMQALDDEIDSPDVCTDPDCFQAKKTAFMHRSIIKAKESGAQVITGKDAKKIAPHGIDDYFHSDNYTRLDSKCYEDTENRTYRQILGESIETVLVEDKEHERLVPMIANTVLAEKLKEVGIESRAAKNDDEAKKLKAKVARERDYRERLFSNLRTEVFKLTLPGVPSLLEAATSWILMRAAEQLFQRLYSDVQAKITTLWPTKGKNPTERNGNFIAETLPRLGASDLWALLVDLTTAGCTLVSEYSIDHEPKALVDMAALFNLDPAQVRKTIVSESNEQQKASKPKKPPLAVGENAKNLNAETSADAPDATKAAQAAEFMAPKSVECAPVAIAAQATEPPPDDAWPALKSKSEELIEMNEKTVQADAIAPVADATELHVGDRVLIKHGLKGMSGQKRKCCGHEGVIEALAGGYIHVRTAPGLNGKITNLVWNEVDKLPASMQAAPAAVTKTRKNSVRASPAERKPVKSKKVLNERTVRA
jgi:ParB/RepB/Spo0J family partition protein